MFPPRPGSQMPVPHDFDAAHAASLRGREDAVLHSARSPSPEPSLSRVGLGLVVIGRNEGERLRRCLQSARGLGACVYVDSGSTDGSTALAQSFGADVIELDASLPFTAARARNAGARRLGQLVPQLQAIQFIDGDCELSPAWLEDALDALAAHADVAAVAGRLRERHVDRSIYNQLCDIEWDTPVGEVRSIGGIAMIRAAAFVAAGGFREDLIAGEEPELCVRLRAAGGRVLRLPHDMAWHDAAMTRWTQWWRRTVRAGHAFAEGASLHGASPERHYVAETRRAALWGLAFPCAVAGLCAVTPLAPLLLLAYPLQVLRLGLRRARQGAPVPWHQAYFLMIGRFAEGWGVLKFHLSRWSGRRSGLIEYK